MDKNEIKAKIAEVVLGYNPKGNHWQDCKDGSYRSPDALPNYPESLNACAEFEKTLTESEQKEYVIELGGRNTSWSGGWLLATRTAPERCEAFLTVVRRRKNKK